MAPGVAPGVATPESVERLLYLFCWDYRQMIGARNNEAWDRLLTVPFHYLPSIAAHPHDPVASRSFIEWAEASCKEILALDIETSPDDYENAQEAQEAFEYHVSLLRAFH